MSDLVKVAVITGVITLVNGPLVIGLLAKKSRKDDEVRKLRGDVAKLFKLVDRIAEGLTYGLENDAVIFNAFRKNAINGASEVQEQKMRDYFSRCATEGFKSGKEG